MKKLSYCILMILLIAGCSSTPSTNALKDTKTIVLGNDTFHSAKSPEFLNLLNHTEFKFLDKSGHVLGSKKYRGNFYKLKIDNNFYYLISSDKFIKGKLSNQDEKVYNFEPSLNAIDSQVYLYEENLYFIDNQGFRSEPTNYLTSIYKNNEKLFDIEDEQATSLVVIGSDVYVLTENNHNQKHSERGIKRKLYRYNIENKMIEKMSETLESRHYTSQLITDSEKLYLYLYIADNVPISDSIGSIEDRLLVIDKDLNVESISDFKRFGPSFTSDVQNSIINNKLYIKSERHELRMIDLNTMERRDLKLEPISDTAQYHYWSQYWYDSSKENLVLFGNFESKPNYTQYVYDLKSGALIETIECPDVSALYRSSSIELSE
ncbi:hypothetical protein [Erysipelothrix sp. strain 2 (EsS2-6-Brazil)]|uniref:hypothetical protein n=1 Tax=Erysipelothrix sp. strain 2 (EsS2-6-Brazil) TaxID=2500549 RepID=UPI00190C34D4|nr:hypothetical protein [Erysipelothrix sp. strain 2 (EsS2-6-Brazil)]MBK2402020.1 hypothetical protein [Erysipelothrix sp. strain 2 (EsS2-6-Brazil)]